MKQIDICQICSRAAVYGVGRASYDGPLCMCYLATNQKQSIDFNFPPEIINSYKTHEERISKLETLIEQLRYQIIALSKRK